MIEIQKCTQPKFQMNQYVYVKISTEILGKEISEIFKLIVISIRRSSSSESETYNYDLTDDPPSAYYRGTTKLKMIPEECICLDELSARQIKSIPSDIIKNKT